MKRLFTGRLLFFLYIFFFALPVLGQGNKIDLTATIPSSLTVCGKSESFEVKLFNTASDTIKDVKLILIMPDGIKYVPGSITSLRIQEEDIDTLNIPVFSVENMPPATNYSIKFKAQADCEAIAAIDSGGIFRNEVRVQYATGFDSVFTNPYAVLSSSLSITSFSNQIVTANPGDTVTRTITITNGGLGGVSSLQITAIYGKGLTFNNIDKPGVIQSGDSTIISISGSDIAAFGDGDTLLEENESITITEKVVISACNDNELESNYTLQWGCNNQLCQQTNTSSDINLPNKFPDLDITTQPFRGTCYEDNTFMTQQVTIINNGTGIARNLSAHLYHSITGGHAPTNSYVTDFDTTSFVVKNGLNGSPIAINIEDYRRGANTACLGKRAINQVFFTVPDIPAGDTVIINWNTNVCCYSMVEENNAWTQGWSFKLAYQDSCEEINYAPPPVEGLRRTVLGRLGQIPGGPTDLNDGQTGTYSFNNASSFSILPGTNDKYVQYRLKLPSCLIPDLGSVEYLAQDLVTKFTPDSVSYVNNELRMSFAIKNTPAFFSHNQSTISVDLTATCAGGCSGIQNVIMTSHYISDLSCSCVFTMDSVSYPVKIHCPGCANVGMNFRGYNIQRTSYGLPDNDNNGIADGAGTLDFSRIRTDRSTYDDTLTAIMKGIVLANIDTPSFEYGYASTKFSLDYLTEIDASLKIYDASAATYYSCNNVPIVKTSGTYNFDFSIPTLVNGGCALPGGFTYQKNDSVIITARYRVSTNIRNASTTVTAANKFYLSLIPNPTNENDKLFCDNYAGSFSVIGAFFTSWTSENKTLASCDTTSVPESFFYSLGPCCGNFAGGNIFPFEYRSWVRVKNIKVMLPENYNFINADVTLAHTTGSGVSTAQVISPSPVNPNADTLEFKISPFYDVNGGTLVSGDDGITGLINLTFLPGCGVQAFTDQTIWYEFEFEPTSDYLVTSPEPFTETSNHDVVNYNAPQLDLKVNLAKAEGITNTVSWDLNITNKSVGSDAHYAWVAITSKSGKISPLQLINLNTGDTILPSGGIYELGLIKSKEEFKYQLIADYNTCSFDSITVFTGWDCTGYPGSLAAYPCTPDSVKLYLDPKPSELELEISNTVTSVNLCDTVPYEIKVNSVQLGAVQNNKFQLTLPTGFDFINGSAEFKYPLNSPYGSIPDPVSRGGGVYEWDISALDSAINAGGLPGIKDTSVNSYKIRFNLLSNCNFKFGDVARFRAIGELSCSPVKIQASTPGAEIAINGFPEPYKTLLFVKTDTVKSCSSNARFEVKVINSGPGITANADHLELTLPEGLIYKVNSTNGVYNAGNVAEPSDTVIGNRQRINWFLESGVAVGDSIIFSFEILDTANLDCGYYSVDMRTNIIKQVACVASGTNCTLAHETGVGIDSVYISKPMLLVSDMSIRTSPVNASSEQVEIELQVSNTGQDVAIGDSIIVAIYHDATGDGVLSAGDVFIGSITSVSGLARSDSLTLNKQFVINNGEACPLIAVIHKSGPLKNCTCSPDEELSAALSIDAGPGVSFCPADTATIGITEVNGYVYNWMPSNGVVSPDSATTEITLLNPKQTPDTSWYTLTVDQGITGCVASDSVMVIVFPDPVAGFYYDTVCQGFTTSFMDTSTIGDGSIVDWQWDFGNGSVSTDINPAIVYDSAGLYDTYLYVTSDKGCKDTATNLVRVYPDPVAAITSDTNGVFEFEKITFIDQSTGDVVIWEWEFGDGESSEEQNPVHRYDTPGKYPVSIKVTNIHNCTDTTSMVINIIPGLKVPNVFTPNGDGINDLFLLPNSGITDYKIFIYNRWGTLLFESTQQKVYWDGKTSSGVDVPEGTYYFILRARDVEGTNYEEAGVVTLIRDN